MTPQNEDGCNQCGNCCADANNYCEHLVIVGTLGESASTYCGVWATRTNGMRIGTITWGTGAAGPSSYCHIIRQSGMAKLFVRRLVKQGLCSVVLK